MSGSSFTEQHPLESLCLLVVDCPHSTPAWTDDGVVVIRNTYLKSGRLDLSNPSFTDHTHYLERIRRAVPQGGDIVISREAPMGEVGMIPEGLQCCLGQRIVLLRPDPDKVDGRYLLYVLLSDDVQRQIRMHDNTGSTVSNLRIPVLKSLSIPTPQRSDQEAIAEILGALDDKIELNRKMNATLDELARTIFRSWFVDFDPVRAKMEGREPFGMDAETAALFPDRLVESSLGPIPNGWQVRALRDAIELNPRRTLKQGSDATFLEMKNVATSGHRPLGLEKRTARGGARFSKGDTLLARITPCLENGKTAFVDFLDADEVGFGSTEYIVMRAKEPHPAIWSYLVARDEAFRAFAIQNMTGTSGRQRVSADSLGQYPLVIPSDSLARVFGESVQPYFDLIKHNDEESQALADLRDTLLPELISGRIRVPEAEKSLAEAM